MGIPKFFRWISERYPLINIKIEGTVAPSIDNLYLDMNGIIHNCTHPSEDITARISEKDMVIAIFNYIDKLFHAIKPTKLFFMAVDGPAPRAKMNQQRGRRFRSALNVRLETEKAIREGKELPKEPAFDSNTITPGTDFMDRLTKHLKWFIRKKISEDASWRGIDVIFSGQEVPGEGEHKIMQYIRHAKSLPDYAPNLTHCIYGLDADLMVSWRAFVVSLVTACQMLGLVTHEPNFCLLREEVLNKESKSSRKDIFQTSQFHFLSLTLLREYLAEEFGARLRGKIDFAFDLERVIDDFVFMCFLIGNDFLPNLPVLDISEGGLDVLFGFYAAVLPQAGGYLTEEGRLVLPRVELLLQRIARFEGETYCEPEIDLEGGLDAIGHVGLESDSDGDDTDEDDLAGPKPAPELVLDLTLRNRFEAFDSNAALSTMRSEPNLDPGKRRDWHLLAEEFGFKSASQGEGDARHVVVTKPEEHTARPAGAAVKAHMVHASLDNTDWMDSYYRKRCHGRDHSDTALVDSMALGYLQGLAWVLHYYHHGCVSWGWYYPSHYAPLASDLCNIQRFADVFDRFELGEPFLPYQQLLAVLPPASCNALPAAYHWLMTDPKSPISDYYPVDFEMDLNGKRNDWEAVVLIPFIDARRLLEAAATVSDARLSADERLRNTLGHTWLFRYDADNLETHPATLPSFFADIREGHSTRVEFDMPTNVTRHVFRLLHNTQCGAGAVGLTPTFQTLPYTSALRKVRINVFGARPSDSATCVITRPPVDATPHRRLDGESETQYLNRLGAMVGRTCIVRWPHWLEARVDAVSTKFGRAETATSGKGFAIKRFEGRERSDWEKDAASQALLLLTTKGLDCTQVDVMLHVQPLAGMRLLENGATKKYFSSKTVLIPLQTALLEHARIPDARYAERPATPLPVLYPLGLRVVCNLPSQYGNVAVVRGHTADGKLELDVIQGPPVPKFGGQVAAATKSRFLSIEEAARELKMSENLLSRLTGTVLVASRGKKLNLGLKLKFNRAMEQIMGYSFATVYATARGENRVKWELSTAAVVLIKEYVNLFPEVLAYLRSHNDKQDTPKAVDVFPALGATEAAARAEAAEKWLDAQPYRKLARVPAGSEALDERAIQLLDQEGAKWRAQVLAGGPLPVVPLSLAPREVRRPVQDIAMIDPNTPTNGRFLLCDRVMNLLDNGPLAFGMQGFVVAFSGTMLTVLFDDEFAAGSTFGDVLSGRKIATSVAAASVLNMTRFNAPSLERNDWFTQVLPASPSTPAPAASDAPRSRNSPKAKQTPLARSTDSAKTHTTPSAPKREIGLPAAAVPLNQSVPATLPSAKPRRARSFDGGAKRPHHASTPTTVFVSGLAANQTDDDLLAFFADCGATKATLLRPGQALVDLPDEANLQRALAKTNSRLGDRDVRVALDRNAKTPAKTPAKTHAKTPAKTPAKPSSTFGKPINTPVAEDPDDFDPDAYFKKLQGGQTLVSVVADDPAIVTILKRPAAAAPALNDDPAIVSAVARPPASQLEDDPAVLSVGSAAKSPQQPQQQKQQPKPSTPDAKARKANNGERKKDGKKERQPRGEPKKQPTTPVATTTTTTTTTTASAAQPAASAEEQQVAMTALREQRLKVFGAPAAPAAMLPVPGSISVPTPEQLIVPAASTAVSAASPSKQKKSKTPCKFFAESGYCRKGAICTFSHELAAAKKP